MPVFKFAKIVSTQTPHRLALPPQEVFATDCDRLQALFLPLVAISLRELDPAWEGEAHWLYNGLHHEDSVSFRMITEQGRTKLIYLGDARGGDENQLQLRKRQGGYLRLVDCEVPVSVAAKPRSANSGPTTDVDTDAPYELMESIADEDLLWMNWFGPQSYACWYQPQNVETPSCPQTGMTMRFVGQISAAKFSDEVADCALYLFYSPEAGILTQVEQRT